MKSIWVLSFIVMASLIATGLAAAQEDGKVNHQTVCPVMGGKIDTDVYVDYEGKRVYFCCKGCPEKFMKKPGSFLQKMKEQGVVLETAPKPQTTCPVMGGKINTKVFVDYGGDRVYFCCKGCPEKFSKTPEKYLAKLEKEGITLARTPKPQEMCPVMGGKVDKAVYADYQGKRVYFCCKGCPDKFLKTPDQFLKKMRKDGVVLAETPKAKKSSEKSGVKSHDNAHHGDGHIKEGSHGNDAKHGSHGKQEKPHHGGGEKKGCGSGGCGG